MKPTEPTSKVLVTGGSVPARKKLQPSLGDEEYEVVSTGDGGEALRRPSPPVVFVVDAALVPRDGYRLCQVIRESAAL
jgi:PleD family two-component response regulator